MNVLIFCYLSVIFIELAKYTMHLVIPSSMNMAKQSMDNVSKFCPNKLVSSLLQQQYGYGYHCIYGSFAERCLFVVMYDTKQYSMNLVVFIES